MITIKVGGKVSDCCLITVRNEEQLLADYCGYVPSEVTENFGKYGDDIEIKIDNETGQIIGWVPLSTEQIKTLSEYIRI